MAEVEVELLVVPNCPNEQITAARLRTALDLLGLTRTQVKSSVVTSQPEADRRGFSGSPTILLDGRDPFPDAGSQPALACRIYLTATAPAGVPTVDELRRVLERATDSGHVDRDE